MNIVYCTCKNDLEARKIAKKVIGEKLAFCTNIISNCNSIYRWKGKIEESSETIIIIKTLPHLVNKLIREIKKLHTYQMPEIVSWKIDDVSPEIVKWASDELKPLR